MSSQKTEYLVEPITKREIPANQLPATYTRLWSELEWARRCIVLPPRELVKRTAVTVVLAPHGRLLDNDQPMQAMGLALAFAPRSLMGRMVSEPPPCISGFTTAIVPAPNAPPRPSEYPIVLTAADVRRRGMPPSYPCATFDPISLDMPRLAPDECCRTFWIEEQFWLEDVSAQDPWYLILTFPQGMHLSPRKIPVERSR